MEQAIIGPTTQIIGRLQGRGDLKIEGKIEGDVELEGSMIVGPSAFVSAPKIAVTELTIEGQVQGDVKATGALIVRAGGELAGDVVAEQIALEDGARFAGKIVMDVQLPSELITK
jgi:cytoskeletal protein CcmA (bactofilin family)